MLKWLVSNNVLCHTVAMTWICSEVYIPNNLREWSGGCYIFIFAPALTCT